MTSCLLCPSPAVADALCVPCGARLWCAQEWMRDPEGMANKRDYPPAEILYVPEREDAIKYMRTPSAALSFLAHLEAAKAARLRKEGACPECERIAPRDEHKTNCSKGNA